jgi:hypothetical protein
MVNLENLPATLCETGLFCLWKYEDRDDRKTKVPYNPKTKERGRSNDRATFAPLPEAVDALDGFDGLGIGIFDDLGAIDIDHCIDEDGKTSALADNIITSMAGYTERSPSGRGIRILFRAPGFSYDKEKYYVNNQKLGLEVYIAGCTNKYVTVTGDTLYPGRDLEDRSAELRSILERYMKREEPAKPEKRKAELERSSTDWRSKLAAAIERKPELRRLYNLPPGSSGDDSAADMALMNHLCYWLDGDAEAMRAAFLESARANRKKAHRRDYQDMTIRAAIKATPRTAADDHQAWIAARNPRVENPTGEDLQPDAIDLIRDGRGVPVKTIENFLRIMRSDPFYKGVRLNLLNGMPEVIRDGRRCSWTDSDEAVSKHYIEQKYGLFSIDRHEAAFKILLREREYHPVRDYLDGLKWDGKPRIENFLSKWLNAEDSPYTREVSRLIFAGGINRIYRPGCKFDLMPVLIGSKQGEGKSTIVRWLALRDDFYGEVSDFEGQKAIEQVFGIWIAEVGELLALTRAREQEGIKAFLTRQVDRYRKPYDRFVSEVPRQCIFIGTTNDRQFLSDKTGNRRFLPVVVRSTGRLLFDHEKEVRADIEQAWAEARERFKKDQLPPVEDRALIDEIRAVQEQALEDDWRIGRIREYLDTQPPGAFVCVRQLRAKALYPTRYDLPEDRKESRDIGRIMDAMDGWERMKEKQRPTNARELGSQWCWRKL